MANGVGAIPLPCFYGWGRVGDPSKEWSRLDKQVETFDLLVTALSRDYCNPVHVHIFLIMMRFWSALLLATVLVRPSLPAQASVDTTISVSGVVRTQHEGVIRWGLFLPAPVVIRSVRVNWVSIDPQASGVANYEDKFVQASGTLRTGTDSTGAATAELVNPQIKERDPEGIVRRNVVLSYTQRSVVTLAVTPTRFARPDSAGHGSGARPLVLFELTNQGDTPLHLVFPRSEVVCVRVRLLQQPGVVVDTSWAIVKTGVKQASIVMGQRYRMIFELPAGAAPVPGTYGLQAGLCPVPDYGAETRFEVTK